MEPAIGDTVHLKGLPDRLYQVVSVIPENKSSAETLVLITPEGNQAYWHSAQLVITQQPFSLTATPASPEPVETTTGPPPLLWWQAKANYYRQLQIQFIDRAFKSAQTGRPDRLQPMRKHEISRLQTLIDEAIAKVTQLGETP